MRPALDSRLDVCILLVLVIGLALAGSCSNSAGPGRDSIASLSVSPASGPPGTVVRITGYDASGAAPDRLSLSVGGRPAPVVVDAGGLLAAVPLFVDSAGSAAPPAGALDLVLRRDGVVVGTAEGALTVEPLPPPTRSLREARSSLQAVAAALDTTIGAFITGAGTQEQYFVAVMAGLDSLVSGADSLSLGPALDALAADSALALVDAVLDAAGVLEGLEEMAVQLAQVSAGAAAGGAAGRWPGGAATRSMGGTPSRAAQTTRLLDQDLARRMQFYVVVQEFGSTVVSQTGATFGQTVGLVAAALGIAVNVPHVAVVSVVLAFIDYVVNKMVVGALPAKIESMDLVLPTDTIAPGDTTTARISITAANVPPTLTLQELVSNVLTALGAAGSGGPSLDSFKDILENTANFFLGTMQGVIASYSAAHPELNLDVDLATTMPALSWTADIDDPHLVQCQSLTPSIVTGMTSSPNWRADSTRYGEGRIYAMPATGSEAVLITLPPGFSYSGGAFGLDATPTPTRSLWVMPNLVLTASLPSPIDPGGAAVLDCTAGYRRRDGTIDHHSGIDISLSVTGGTAEETSGTTDANGRFTTVIHADQPGATAIDVVVRADGAGGSHAEARANAAVSSCDPNASASGNASVVYEGPYNDQGGYYHLDITVSCSAGLDPAYVLVSLIGRVNSGVYDWYAGGDIRTTRTGPGTWQTDTMLISNSVQFICQVWTGCWDGVDEGGCSAAVIDTVYVP